MTRSLATFVFAILFAGFAFASKTTVDTDVRNSAQFKKITAAFEARGGWIMCGTIVTLGAIEESTEISSYCSADRNDGDGMVQLLMRGTVRGLDDQKNFEVLQLRLFSGDEN